MPAPQDPGMGTDRRTHRLTDRSKNRPSPSPSGGPGKNSDSKNFNGLGQTFFVPHKMHYTVLHCTTLHCTALHCTVLHCTVQWESATAILAFSKIIKFYTFWRLSRHNMMPPCFGECQVSVSSAKVSVSSANCVIIDLNAKDLHYTALHCTALYCTAL